MPCVLIWTQCFQLAINYVFLTSTFKTGLQKRVTRWQYSLHNACQSLPQFSVTPFPSHVLVKSFNSYSTTVTLLFAPQILCWWSALKLKTTAAVWVTMVSNNRRHQIAVSLSLSQSTLSLTPYYIGRHKTPTWQLSTQAKPCCFLYFVRAEANPNVTLLREVWGCWVATNITGYLNNDRPTWCHLFYYFIIYCSTCFGC